MRRPNADQSKRLHEIDADIERLLQEKSRLALSDDIETRVSNVERDLENATVVIDLGAQEGQQEQPAQPQVRPRSLFVRLRQLLSWCYGKRRMS